MKTSYYRSALIALLCPFLAPQATSAAETTEVTPLSLPGAETIMYREVEGIELRLFIVKPEGWQSSDQRPALIAYFGGGWASGNVERSIRYAQWAAEYGMIGIAPDYRTRKRFGGSPEDCVADARAAMRWVQAHADELGINPRKIVAHGASAGGHLALWTAIPTTSPGPNDPAPEIMPAGLILLNPVSDTKEGGYGGPRRFGNSSERALALSVPDQMPEKMPPTLIFHATADQTVPYANSVALRDQLHASGNDATLVTFEGLGHAYYSSRWGQGGKQAYTITKADSLAFLQRLGLIQSSKPE
jgi:acetyl esterase